MAKRHTRSTDDDYHDWESHTIIRFPSDVASRVKEVFASGSNANDRFALTMNDDLRTGSINFDGEKMLFTLYDLPTITEVMKTQDNISMYKVADISQMIVCSKEKGQLEKNSAILSNSDQHSKVDDIKFKWPDGLCPSMKNARELRFRKVKKKKYMDIPEVEKELKKLLRADLKSRSVRWEVVEGEEDVNASQLIDSSLQELEVQEKSADNFADERPEIDLADLSLSEDEDDDQPLLDKEEDIAPEASKQPDFLMDLHLSSDSSDDDILLNDENSRLSNLS